MSTIANRQCGEPSKEGDVIRGAVAIGAAIALTERAARHLISKGELKSVRGSGVKFLPPELASLEVTAGIESD